MIGSIPIPNTRFYLTSIDGKKWFITECEYLHTDLEGRKGVVYRYCRNKLGRFI